MPFSLKWMHFQSTLPANACTSLHVLWLGYRKIWRICSLHFSSPIVPESTNKVNLYLHMKWNLSCGQHKLAWQLYPSPKRSQWLREPTYLSLLVLFKSRHKYRSKKCWRFLNFACSNFKDLFHWRGALSAVHWLQWVFCIKSYMHDSTPRISLQMPTYQGIPFIKSQERRFHFNGKVQEST